MENRKYLPAGAPRTSLLGLICGSSMLLGTTQTLARPAVADNALDAVTVSATKMRQPLVKTPGGVTVLSGDEVDQGVFESVNELASKVPNMTVNPSGGVNIRGVEGTGAATGVNAFIGGGRARITTTVDGVDELWTGQQYLDVDLWDVDQVEVLRGPQSTTQGRNAIGGVVAIRTKDPSFVQEGAARLGWATADGRANLAGMVSGPLIDNQLAYRLTADGVKGNSFIQYKGFDNGKSPSALQNYTLRGKLLWTPTAIAGLRGKLTLGHRSYQGFYLNIVNGNKPDDYTFTGGPGANVRTQDSTNDTLSAETDYDIGGGLSAHFQYSYSKSKVSFEQRKSPLTLNLNDVSQTAEARLVYHRPGSALSGVAGLFASDRDQTLLARTKVFDGTDRMKTLAVYGDGSWALDQRWSLLLGARVENERQNRNVLGWGNVPIRANIDNTIFLPKLGVSYQLAPKTMLAVTARKGYNPGAVTLDENDHAYQYDSEKVDAYELSLKSAQGRLNVAANLFYNRYHNYQMLHGGRIQNVPQGHTYGLELSADATVQGGWQWNANLGLMTSRVDRTPSYGNDIAGKQFSYAPEITASAGVKKQWGHFFAGLDANYVGKYFTDSSNNGSQTGGNGTQFNLNTGYNAGPATLRFYVKNLTNETTVLRRYSGARSNNYYVSAPRTFGVSVDYRF